MYEERAYRAQMKPEDLTSYEVRLKETDLFCSTKGDLRGLVEERVLLYRHQLETYIERRPEFLESLSPLTEDPLAPKIVREMIGASRTVGVGPMACVAGAIAEFIGRDLAPVSDEFIIENGGDICLRTRRERSVLLYAKDSPYSGKLGIRVKPGELPLGVCTSSGTVGPSLSLGNADAVCVLAPSALFADGLATRVGNIVKKQDDIDEALEVGKAFPGVLGLVVIFGRSLGVWGEVDLIKL